MSKEKSNIHTVYKITNLINGNIYIGKHSTRNLNDGYLGSGTLLLKALKKHGKENFKKEILKILPSSKDAYIYEKSLVTATFVKRKDTYNLHIGGDGGWDGALGHVNVRDENGVCFRVRRENKDYLNKKLVSVAANTIVVKDKKGNTSRVNLSDPKYLSKELVPFMTGMVTIVDKEGRKEVISTKDERYLSGELTLSNKGHPHTEESKKKIGLANSKNRSKDKNSQYGTCWIYNLFLEQSKRIIKEDLSFYVEKGWEVGRIITFNKKNISSKTKNPNAPAYGRIWVLNNILKENKFIIKKDKSAYLLKGWVCGRNLNFHKS